MVSGACNFNSKSFLALGVASGENIVQVVVVTRLSHYKDTKYFLKSKVIL